MPLFEYRCQDCGTQFEKIVLRASDSVECTSCRGPNLEKLLSVFAVKGGTKGGLSAETGPCGCGAPRRGMCGE